MNRQIKPKAIKGIGNHLHCPGAMAEWLKARRRRTYGPIAWLMPQIMADKMPELYLMMEMKCDVSMRCK